MFKRHCHDIVLGGGFHHCSGSSGGGFCAYADITLAIKVHIARPHPVELSILHCLFIVKSMKCVGCLCVNSLSRVLSIEFFTNSLQCLKAVQ